MMIDKSLPIREVGLNTASSKGAKRKLTGQTTAEEMKPSEVEVKAVKASKAPLKADLIIKLKALEKAYEDLDKNKHKICA